MGSVSGALLRQTAGVATGVRSTGAAAGLHLPRGRGPRVLASARLRYDLDQPGAHRQAGPSRQLSDHFLVAAVERVFMVQGFQVLMQSARAMTSMRGAMAKEIQMVRS